MFKFELGQDVKEIVTGFNGIIMARTEHLTSCNAYGICSRELSKDGKPQEWMWYDEPRLALTGKKSVEVQKPESGQKFGGPNYSYECAPQR